MNKFIVKFWNYSFRKDEKKPQYTYLVIDTEGSRSPEYSTNTGEVVTFGTIAKATSYIQNNIAKVDQWKYKIYTLIKQFEKIEE